MNNIRCNIKPELGAKLPTLGSTAATCYDVYAHRIIIHTLKLADGYTSDAATKGEAIPVAEGVSVAEMMDYCHLSWNKINYIECNIGFTMAPEEGWGIKGHARSSMAIAGFSLINSVAIIDNDFRDCAKMLYAPRNATADFSIFKIGNKCGQIEFHEITRADFEQVDPLPASDRGTGGFGSTGNN